MTATATKPKHKKTKKPAKAKGAKAKTKPEPAPPSHDHDDDAKYIARIAKQEKLCQESEKKWDEAKEEAKKAHEEHDADMAQLRSMIRAYDQPLPLFSSNGQAEAHPDDSWKALSIVQLGLTPGVIDKLAKAGLDTIGEFVAFQGKWGEWWHTKLEGVKAKTRDKIDDAILKFFEKHPEYQRARVQDLAATVGTGQTPPAPEQKPEEKPAAEPKAETGDSGEPEDLYPDGVRSEE